MPKIYEFINLLVDYKQLINTLQFGQQEVTLVHLNYKLEQDLCVKRMIINFGIQNLKNSSLLCSDMKHGVF